MTKIKIGSIGLGPVGSIIAVYLADSGAEIIAVDLPYRIEQLRENGLQVQWKDKFIKHDVSVVDSIRSLASEKPDYILISTKACVLPKIMPDVAIAAGQDSLVISVQNGIGTEDLIGQHVPPQNVGRMAVNYAGSNDEKGMTHVSWFTPPNFLGLLKESDDTKLSRFVEMLNSVGLTSEMVDPFTIKKKVFLKTILNSALMPTCGLLNITMKGAMDGKATRRLTEDLLRESIEVAESLGYDYGKNIFNECIGYLEKGGDHHPSMSFDLQRKLPTEIEFINGKILELGLRNGVTNLEVSRVMVSMIMTLEVINGTRKPDDFPDYVI